MAFRDGNPNHSAGAAHSRKGRRSNSVHARESFTPTRRKANSPSHTNSFADRIGESSAEEGMTTADRVRNSAHAGYSAYAAVVKRRRRKRIILGAIGGAVAIVALVAVVAFAYMGSINSNLRSGISDDLMATLATTDTPSEPFYTLLLGVDGSEARESMAEFADGNFRSDSMMLVRIDPGNKKATLVSIPRDILIEPMGEYGPQKINAALALGGPALAVETVSDLAGVPIAHYAELNFDGFREVVDSLGGIEVDVPIEINDPEAGGHLDAGLQTLNGDQALILCRSRHAYDEYGAGDLYRAANQRVVLSAIAQKLLASDPITIANSISALSSNVTTDLSVEEIIAIAQGMRGMSGSDIYTSSVPTVSEYIGDGWYEIVQEDEWEDMMDRIDSGLPPSATDVIDEATGTVMSSSGDGAAAATSKSGNHAVNRKAAIGLRNGNGQSGICVEAEKVLNGLGYTEVESRNADSFDYPNTIIVYKEDKYAADAEVIAKEFGVGQIIDDDQTYLFDGDLLIVLGAD